MGVFHVFKIVQMVPNRVKHHNEVFLRKYLITFSRWLFVEKRFNADVWLGNWYTSGTNGYISNKFLLYLCISDAPRHIKTSQLISKANQLTGFYMIENIGR